MTTVNSGGYPVQLVFPESNKVANWRPLAHWAMAIPHLFISGILSMLGQVVAFVSWVTILATGKLPAGIADFQVMTVRYSHRANMYMLGLTEDFPPFSFDTVATDPGDHSVQLSIQPQLEDRNRLTVFFRMLMAFPLLIVGSLIFVAVSFVYFIAWFAVLFTGTYPNGMRNFVIGSMRYQVRMNAYMLLLTDEYPPFNLDA
jgi:hypothetical protein